MRFTSVFPPKKYTEWNLYLLREFLDFISGVDHNDIVFADEIPMAEIETNCRVRRDLVVGDVPANVSARANSRFATISLRP
jgi:hypothetical protein